MADAAVEVNFPGPAPYEHRTSTVGPSTGEDVSEDVVTPRQEAAQTELAHVTEDRAALARRKQVQADAVVDVEKKNIELQRFADESQQLLRTGPEAQRVATYIDMARNRLRDQQDKLDKMPAPALFADREGWGKLRLGIGMAMAGLGDGMMAAAMIRAGHAPSGRSTVRDIIETDLERQRAAIARQKDSVVMARTGLDDAKEARNVLLADIELKGKQMYRKAELLTRERLAGLKLDQNSIDTTKEILDYNAAQAEQKSKFADAHGKNVKSRWDSAKTTVEDVNRTPAATGKGGGVEAEKAGAQYALFKAHAEKAAAAMPGLTPDEVGQINRVMSSESFLEGKGTISSALQSVGLDAETGASSRVKEYLEDVRRGAAALGRMDSGAAIGTVENIRFQRSIMPSNSDTKKDREMRAANIVGDVKTRGEFLGRPGKFAAPAAGGAPAAPPEFSAARVSEAKRIAQDKAAPRAKRDRAREYIQAARAAGVN